MAGEMYGWKREAGRIWEKFLNTRGVHTPAASKKASQGSTVVEPAGERTVSPVMVLSGDVMTSVTKTGWWTWTLRGTNIAQAGIDIAATDPCNATRHISGLRAKWCSARHRDALARWSLPKRRHRRKEEQLLSLPQATTGDRRWRCIRRPPRWMCITTDSLKKPVFAFLSTGGSPSFRK